MSTPRDITKKKEMHDFLKEHGYSLIRHGKHEVWGRGTHHISLPTGDRKNMNPLIARRLVKEILSKVGSV